MDKKFSNDKRPHSARLISSFEEPQSGDGTFTGERTIPGTYDSFPEHTEHDSGFDAGQEYAGLADLIDPTLDSAPLASGDTLDHEFVEFTQTDLQAVAEDSQGHAAQTSVEMHGLLLDCLGVIDDLERVIESSRSESSDEKQAQVAGVEAVRDGFLSRLVAYGVEHEPCRDERYDPDMHEITRAEAVADSEQDGIVISVERAGYTRNGQPLRRAHVVVGKKD